MLWDKFHLTDLDPRTLSAKPMLCIIAGFGAFTIAGWCVAMLGGWLWWLLGVAGLAVAAFGIREAVREKREQDASDDGAGA